MDDKKFSIENNFNKNISKEIIENDILIEKHKTKETNRSITNDNKTTEISKNEETTKNENSITVNKKNEIKQDKLNNDQNNFNIDKKIDCDNDELVDKFNESNETILLKSNIMNSDKSKQVILNVNLSNNIQMINETDDDSIKQGFKNKSNENFMNILNEKQDINQENEKVEKNNLKDVYNKENFNEELNQMNDYDTLIINQKQSSINLKNKENQVKTIEEQQLNTLHQSSSNIPIKLDEISSQTQDENIDTIKKLKTELSRLKNHLIEIEDSYTNELIESQRREQNLENELIECKTEIEQLNNKLNNTGPLKAIRAQAEQALDERDQALQRCSKLEDEVQRSQISLANLQLVIERIQKENDQRIQSIKKIHNEDLLKEQYRYSNLEEECNRLKNNLRETNSALYAATRLSQQLDAKKQAIDQLKLELKQKEDLITNLQKEIDDLSVSNLGKVDKQIIKNLVVNYFNAALDKKQDVARLLARILDFNEQEMKKSGIQLSFNNSSYKPDLNHRRQNSSSLITSNFSLDESFTQQFVHFLEEESKVPKIPIVKKLAQDLTKAVTPEQSKINDTNEITTTQFPIINYHPIKKTDDKIDLNNSNKEVKPMLILNNAIVNAQVAKLTINNVSSQANSNLNKKLDTSLLNQSSNLSYNLTDNPETKITNVKPVVIDSNVSGNEKKSVI